jgi:hypothetical protein
LSKEAEAVSAVVLHCPVVLLLYPEVMSSDFIKDFPETDLFSQHLDVISLKSSMMLFLILFCIHKCVEI